VLQSEKAGTAACAAIAVQELNTAWNRTDIHRLNRNFS